MKKRFVLALAVFTLFSLSGYTSFFNVTHWGDECLMRSVFGDNANSSNNDNRAYFAKQFGLSLDNIYWGEFHCHTNYSIDAAVCSANSPDKAYAYARDQTDLDFVALSDHAEEQNITAIPKKHKKLGLNNWLSTLKIAQKYNNESLKKGKVFIIFPGWEYTNTYGVDACRSIEGYGHKNVFFKNLNASELPLSEYGACVLNTNSEFLAEDAIALWNALDGYRPAGEGEEGSALTVVHTPANVSEKEDDALDHRTDWRYMDQDFVRHVEIYSKWGNSEGPPPDELSGDTECIDEELFEYTRSAQGDPLSIRPVLYNQWVLEGNSDFVLGFVGGTDNHIGCPGNKQQHTCGGFNRRGGITGIVAPGLTRNKLWSSLWNRHTIATSTGMRMGILFAVQTDGNHIFMGEQGGHNGSVRIRALASDNAEKLEVIVDGCVKYAAQGHEINTTLTLPDSRHYIYIRAWATVKGEKFPAWSSPVYLGTPGIGVK